MRNQELLDYLRDRIPQYEWEIVKGDHTSRIAPDTDMIVDYSSGCQRID